MVSKMLGESLDRLASAIALAEKQLSRLPNAENCSLELFVGFLTFVDGRLTWRICNTDHHNDDGTVDWTKAVSETILEETPLAELPVNMRTCLANSIPDFIAKVVAEEPNYCRNIDDIAGKIEHAVADCQGGAK